MRAPTIPLHQFVICLLVVLTLIVLPLSCKSQTIEGPDQVEVMHPAWLTFSGIPATASTAIWPSDVATTDPTHIAPRSILFWAKEPGTYTIQGLAVDHGTSYLALLVKKITVVGDIQPPDDDDEGLPLPPPNSEVKWQVKLFTDKDKEDNWPTEQVAVLNGLKFREELTARGDRFLGSYNISPKVQATWPLKSSKACVRDRYGNQTCYVVPVPSPPADSGIGDAWWDAIRGDPLPRIAVSPIDGGLVQDFNLPANLNDTLKLLGSLK